MARKVFVPVMVQYDIEGKMTPIAIEWEDGTIFEIDKVLDVRRAASLKAGGQGIRYTIRIGNRETYLFYENPNWFVVGKE